MKKILSKILRFAARTVDLITYLFTRPDENMALFISFHGKGYSDSPKAIYEYMLADERCRNLRFVWVLNRKTEDIPGNPETVKYRSLKYFYYMHKAKYWIFNCKMPPYTKKKPSQVYFQTWHGTPIKRLGYDQLGVKRSEFYRSGQTFEEMTKSYSEDSKKYDYMVSANRFSTEVFQSAFKVKKEKLVEIGYPRNDYFINADEKEKERIKRDLGIPEDKKVLLYAPTWRDNSYNLRGYVFELKADFRKWKEMLSDEYVLLYKPHYLITNALTEEEKGELGDFLYEIDATEDIARLYVISDAMITDYSSVFFDYSVLGRPMYFYMYDLEEYKDELRGFYLDVHTDIPGEIYTDEEKMLSDIKEGIYDYERLEKFNEEFNAFNKGDSSRQAVDIIFGDRS